MLGKDFFRNGQNTQFARINMGWTEKTSSSQEKKYNLEVIDNTRIWSTTHNPRALIEPAP